MWEGDAGYFVFMVVRLRWDGFESVGLGGDGNVDPGLARIET